MKFEVIKAETMGGILRIEAQELAGPVTREPLTLRMDLPLRRARAFYVGRVFRLAVKPLGGGS